MSRLLYRMQLQKYESFLNFCVNQEEFEKKRLSLQPQLQIIKQITI